MELVSANTRNYLFLTMSQYNEQNALVRARCTMRRDQAFWQGGNSFVACESFRISSAPSQGGLYYTILPDDFYIGALNRETNPEEKEAFDPLLKAGRTLEAATIKPTVIHHGTVLTIPISMCISAMPQLGSAIVESKPSAVLPMVGELWNDHGIQKDQQIQMICYNTNNPVGITGVVQNEPLVNLTGAGGGPDGMFYPITGQWEPENDWPGDNGAPQMMVDGEQGAMDLTNLGLDGIKSTSSSILGALTQMLGRDCHLELATGNDGTVSTVPVGLRTGGLIFMGPAYIEVDRLDIWNKNPAGQNTSLKKKIYWDQDTLLQVGDEVWTMTAQQGAVAAHRQYGKITAINNDFLKPFHDTSNPHFHVQGASLTGGMWKLSDAYKAWYNDASNIWKDRNGGDNTGYEALAQQLDHLYPWVMSSSETHMPEAIVCQLEVKIDDTNQTVDMNAFHPALPITEFKIRKGNDRALNRVEHRSCAQGEEKYIYTPNELYWLFNNPQGDSKVDGTPATATPYLLQTHENGGFKVAWDGTFSDFYMTVSMHDALGLNDYFEYNYTKKGSSQSNWDMCIQRIQSGAGLWYDNYQQSVIHVPATDCFVKGSDPLIPVDPVAITIGTPVVSHNGVTEYILVSKQVITDTEEKNEVLKVYPIQSVDSDGIAILTWKNLPESIMGNTQQVSVESFGTFSGINIVIPNLPFQPMLGTASDDRILASLRLPFEYGTENKTSGIVSATDFSYYGDLLFNSDSSRSYLRITTDQQLYDCDVEARLIRRDGGMEVLYIPYKGQFEIKLRFLQTQ